jgi:hypothetical protein
MPSFRARLQRGNPIVQSRSLGDYRVSLPREALWVHYVHPNDENSNPFFGEKRDFMGCYCVISLLFDQRPSLAYTLVRNKAHTNAAFMFGESDRREHDKDTLTAYPGLLGSYPNYFFVV